ncbi:MAG: DUF5056 domain-containing protein [Prevotella sp.]
MIEDKDDLLINSFLNEHPIIVEKDAFNHRVMRNLRNDETRLGYIWTGLYVAAVIIVLLTTDILQTFIGSIKGFVVDIMTNDIVIGSPIVIVIFILATFFFACYRIGLKDDAI